MIKAITFDLDGVYFVNGKSNFIKNLAALGVPEEEGSRVFLQSDEMNKLYKTGKWTDEQFWQWAGSEWKLNKTPDELVRLLIDGYEINQEVAEMVKKVRAHGYKTLVCSNNFHARINGLHERFGFKDDFDVVVLACDVGVTKPDPGIFEELIKASGVKAEEIYIADDNEQNLSTAKSLGIQTHYYTNFANFLNSLRELGVNI